MIDLTSEMAQLWASLRPRSPGQPRVVLFSAARPGEGVSTIAREFARYCTRRSRGAVWLVDMDLAGAGQYQTILDDKPRFGALGGPSAASPDGSSFFVVHPRVATPNGRAWGDDRYLVAYPVGVSRLWVTRFRREALLPGQRPGLTSGAAYWSALRRHAEWIVIDAPASEAAEAALAVTAYADATVLVVSADGADAAGPAALKEAIAKAGGSCAGLVFNRARLETPSFLRGRAAGQ